MTPTYLFKRMRLVGDRMHMISGNFKVSITDIKNIIDDDMRSAHSKSVVVIDYLQLVRVRDGYDKRDVREKCVEILDSMAYG